ncbi:hypothetical protein [Kyrpidia tusciae]|uniref:Uncharacterized protein n=1 Tax=Kyrpidia tusciae (strain DSM 2912 / NBRC 15312 / T2) TaxID=562970 RepID=D5WWR7_KYRT2|nr:hypothetical protein [Kyrpidia tusciae]ADG05768.1 conserved hypothetical protein [Kyrpidia tusciae DSM 2912]MBE3552045.1 hypothetical protein [Kyrpidia tusciae]
MKKLWRVKALRGELRRTEIRRNTGFQLTTQEFVLQKESQAYHIAFDDILGVVEQGSPPAFPEEWSGDTRVPAADSPGVVKIVATNMRIHRPGGITETGAGTLHVRLSEEFTLQLLRLLKKD